MKRKEAAFAVAQVAIFFGVIALVSLPVQSSSTGLSETCRTVTLSSTEVTSTDCRLGLTFTLSIQHVTLAPGMNQTVTISIHNDKSVNNNITFTGFPATPGGLTPSSPEASVFLLPTPGCSANISGYLALYNSTSAPLQLNTQAPSSLGCGISGPSESWHQFAPLQTSSQSFKVGGYYTSSDRGQPWINATYFEFFPGQQYEVFAFDGWGQLLTLSFLVV